MKQLTILLAVGILILNISACGDDDEKVEQRTDCRTGGVFIDDSKIIDFSEPGNCENVAAFSRQGDIGGIEFKCFISQFECSGGTAASYSADCGKYGTCSLKR
ncbi:MAG: hypothetical protein Kow0090_06680 [Myxococcota bacterium]